MDDMNRNMDVEPLRMDNEPSYVPPGQQGSPQGAPQGFSQGMMQGTPQGMPQGVPAGYPQGVSAGYPQGAPAGTPQGTQQFQQPQGQGFMPQQGQFGPPPGQQFQQPQGQGFIPQQFVPRPADPPKPKKKMSKKAKILLFGGIGLLFAAIATFCVLRFIVFTPKKSVKKAMDKTFTVENMSHLVPMSDEFGWNDLNAALKANGGTITVSAEIDSAKGKKEAEGCGLGLEINSDPASKTLSAEVQLTDHGTSVLTGQYIYDENQSAITVPGHLNGYYIFNNKGIISQLAQMPILKDKMGSVSLPSDFDLQFFGDQNIIADKIKEFIDDIWEDAKVSSEGSEKLTLGSKSYKCNKYEVVIPKSVLEDLVDQLAERAKSLASQGSSISSLNSMDQVITMLKSQLQDLHLNMYLYDGKVVAITSSGNISVVKYDLDFRFIGEGNLYNGFSFNASLSTMGRDIASISATVNTTETDNGIVTSITATGGADDDDFVLDFTSTFSKATKGFSVDGEVTASGELILTVTGNGTFTRLDPGQAFTLEMENVTIADGDVSDALILHGSVSFDTTKKNVLTRDAGLPTLNIFEATEESMQKFKKDNWKAPTKKELGVWEFILDE